MTQPIQHTVTFRLNEGVDQDWFLTRARDLAEIPGVLEFEVLAQVGKKAAQFHLALSMWFSSEEDYASYNAHSDHVDFVENVWMPNVAEFLELDYLRISS